MITIDEYVKPKSAGEAYALLAGGRNASVIGGGLFIRLNSKKIGLAVDLSEAGLDFLQETGENIEIGAMCTFGELEKSPLLKKYFSGVIPVAVSGIVGTQFKNMATVGGTVCSRLGFSELITCLLALPCTVVLHGQGEMSLESYLGLSEKGRDILEKVVLKKTGTRAAYKVFKNTSGSLPILAVAVSKTGGDYRIAVGARPGAAALALKAADYLKETGPGGDAFAQAAEIASAELHFAGDRRASEKYRRELCKVLVKRALAEV